MVGTMAKIAVRGALVALVVAVASAGVAAATPVRSYSAQLKPFAPASVSGNAVNGTPFNAAQSRDQSREALDPAGGSGLLSIFQQASATPLDVSVDRTAPVALTTDSFSY